MKNITKKDEAASILNSGGFRFLHGRIESYRLIRRLDGLFEFRLHRGHDITQTQETIAHQLIEAAAKQSCILGVALAAYEKVSDREGDQVIVVQFTLEQKDEPKGKPGESTTLPPGQGEQIETGRQWIGVYVDNDEDAKKVIEALTLLKAGCFIHAGLWDKLRQQTIPSLDWDSFEPSYPEDEAWRK